LKRRSRPVLAMSSNSAAARRVASADARSERPPACASSVASSGCEACRTDERYQRPLEPPTGPHGVNTSRKVVAEPARMRQTNPVATSSRRRREKAWASAPSRKATPPGTAAAAAHVARRSCLSPSSASAEGEGSIPRVRCRRRSARRSLTFRVPSPAEGLPALSNVPRARRAPSTPQAPRPRVSRAGLGRFAAQLLGPEARLGHTTPEQSLVVDEQRGVHLTRALPNLDANGALPLARGVPREHRGAEADRGDHDRGSRDQDRRRRGRRGWRAVV